jgi:diacylglycerol kinase (ATP)
LPEPEPAPESPFKGRSGVARIVQAFFNSLAGLQDAWRHESAFRQESFLAAALVTVAALLPVTPVERALLLATPLLVLVVELLNSGVEAAIDRIGLDRHDLSRRAKDLGSAAVLVTLLLLALVWGVILLPHAIALAGD